MVQRRVGSGLVRVGELGCGSSEVGIGGVGGVGGDAVSSMGMWMYGYVWDGW